MLCLKEVYITTEPGVEARNKLYIQFSLDHLSISND